MRVVVVTGAARGLGRAIALGLAEAGLTVVAVCRPGGTAPAASPPGGLVTEADVSDPLACDAVVRLALDRFGRLDALINNAAVAHADFPDMHETPPGEIAPDAWRRVIEANVNGTFFMSRAAAPALTAADRGRLVNLSTSKSSMLAPGVLPYGPSKAAVEAMTVGWARHFEGSGVTVNAVLPGGPAGERAADKHWWAPDARSWPASIVVPPIRWLLSPEADGFTGRRIVARLWDATLPGPEAAERASSPAGWPIGPDDTAQPPP